MVNPEQSNASGPVAPQVWLAELCFGVGDHFPGNAGRQRPGFGLRAAQAG